MRRDYLFVFLNRESKISILLSFLLLVDSPSPVPIGGESRGNGRYKYAINHLNKRASTGALPLQR